jgi:hypothetical protein
LISPRHQISSSDSQDLGQECILLDVGLHSLLISENIKKQGSVDPQDLENIESLGGDIKVKSTIEICQSFSFSDLESDVPLNCQTSSYENAYKKGISKREDLKGKSDNGVPSLDSYENARSHVFERLVLEKGISKRDELKGNSDSGVPISSDSLGDSLDSVRGEIKVSPTNEVTPRPSNVADLPPNTGSGNVQRGRSMSPNMDLPPNTGKEISPKRMSLGQTLKVESNIEVPNLRNPNLQSDVTVPNLYSLDGELGSEPRIKPIGDFQFYRSQSSLLKNEDLGRACPDVPGFPPILQKMGSLSLLKGIFPNLLFSFSHAIYK